MSGLIRKLLRAAVPPKGRIAIRNFTFEVLDGFDAILGRNAMLPPRKMRFVGDGDFVKTGEEFVGHFRRFGGLSPDDRVLDIGSGIGRMAIPLTRFLSPKGRYDGLEIVPEGVTWCQKHITPRHPNFNFHWIDVYNFEYNPNGRQSAASYRFPFSDSHFDFSFLTSVFTHMLPADFENYVSEIARVLVPGGRCFATMFLLNEASQKGIKAGGLVLDFKYEGPGYLTVDPKMPECAIAFPEDYVLRVFAQHGLTLAGAIQYGSWCGRPDFLSYQDALIFQKSL